MMARKLSVVARCASLFVIAGSVPLAALIVLAEGEIQVTAPSAVVENPFVASQPKPPIVSEEPPAAHRGPIAYQNPFANVSKAPPIDTSLRPGPVSRWQHPVIPHAEPSAVKAAVLSQPLPQPAEPAHLAWDQLPPAESLRQLAAAQHPTDPALMDRLAGQDQIIHVTPTPLAQPIWVNTDLDQAIAPESSQNRSGLAHFAESSEQHVPVPLSADSNQITSAFAIIDSADSAISPVAREDDLPTIVSDCEDTPESWLAQAQDAATRAESAEDLSTVIDLCDRGLHGTPSAKLLSSLRRLSAWAYNRRGEMVADAQRPDDAIQDFQVAISMDSTCSLAIHNRAVTLAQRNQFAAALRDFNRVIELNPGLAVAYRNRAELLAALGRMEEAVADYDRAIASLPDDAALHRARAHAYQRLGNFAHATADINRAIQLAPHDPDALTQRGNLAAEQGKFAQAQEDFQQALAIDSNWAEAYRSLAWLQATSPDRRYRNADQALASAQQAAQRSSPDDYLILDTLAAAHACRGHFDQAIELQQKAVAAAPRDLSTPLEDRLALYQRGQAYSGTPAPSDVRTISHETTTTQPTTPRPSPTEQLLPR